MAGTSLILQDLQFKRAFVRFPPAPSKRAPTKTPHTHTQAERNDLRVGDGLLAGEILSCNFISSAGGLSLAHSNGGGGELRLFFGGFLDLLIPSVVFVL